MAKRPRGKNKDGSPKFVWDDPNQFEVINKPDTKDADLVTEIKEITKLISDEDEDDA
jgi:hypothetical protein